MASIRKRGDSYRVTVSNGRDVSGKQIIETATFAPDPSRTEKQNRKALEIFAFEFEQKVKSGKYLDGEKISFKDFSVSRISLCNSNHSADPLWMIPEPIEESSCFFISVSS